MQLTAFALRWRWQRNITQLYANDIPFMLLNQFLKQGAASGDINSPWLFCGQWKSPLRTAIRRGEPRGQLWVKRWPGGYTAEGAGRLGGRAGVNWP